ncbi:hypothetical protein C2W58_00750 [Bacillus pumilus]|uniref:Uncharacterized protein n=1 Tax=Bacillus pumilus TaxID=1408 RepID=A0AB34QYC0_BACPU|nr:hypothetical protein B4127_0842 [Bacillus pumilus]RAP09069.1 hypothetical protein C2W58_00750 [Bacillus pumilus]
MYLVNISNWLIFILLYFIYLIDTYGSVYKKIRDHPTS